MSLYKEDYVPFELIARQQRQIFKDACDVGIKFYDDNDRKRYARHLKNLMRMV